ncbi:GatB/YqeY domain-containing protein [Bacillus safensis]|uniref:GatB/YqeY domain-containing protein n=1 Tax=Bacillus TaxID=1386 RepID=UPI002271A159|nr:GatB/YqeY domain-containing protein [Bacillus safensis]MCY1118991.1 GatB/YqeY domain-containing protein [Bacillus safensis]
MSLLEQLNSDMKLMMKNREKDKLVVIRMVKASLQNEAIKLKKDSLTGDEELTVLSREIKQRKDSLHEFSKANRLDLVDKVQKEIDILDVYLPEQLSEEELQTIVKETIAETGASSKADMGKVMSAIMPKVKGKADGAGINRLVSEQLSQ